MKEYNITKDNGGYFQEEDGTKHFFLDKAPMEELYICWQEKEKFFIDSKGNPQYIKEEEVEKYKKKFKKIFDWIENLPRTNSNYEVYDPHKFERTRLIMENQNEIDKFRNIKDLIENRHLVSKKEYYDSCEFKLNSQEFADRLLYMHYLRTVDYKKEKLMTFKEFISNI